MTTALDIDKWIEPAVRKFSAGGDQEEVVRQLVEQGCDPDLAEVLIGHIPSAYARAVLDSFKVIALKDYARPLTNGTDRRVKYAEDPVWIALLAFIEAQQLLGKTADVDGRISLRSAELNALNQMILDGSAPENLVLATAHTYALPLDSPLLPRRRWLWQRLWRQWFNRKPRFFCRAKAT